MNFLDLCRAVVREGAIVPGALKPETVKNQTGRMQLVVDWVNRSNREIQSERNDFSFRSREIDFSVPEGALRLAPEDTQPDVESLNEFTGVVRDDLTKKPIPPMSWMEYRMLRVTDPKTTTELPDFYSVDPSGKIHFYPEASKSFVFRGEFRLQPQTMSENDDQPWIPAGYRDVILYKALMYFHNYDESYEQYQVAERYYTQWLEKLISATCPVSDWARNQSSEGLMVITNG